MPPIQRGIASLVRAVLVAGVVALAADPQPVRAQDGAQSPEARARTFVELVASGQYAQAFEMFTPQGGNSITVTKLSGRSVQKLVPSLSAV